MQVCLQKLESDQTDRRTKFPLYSTTLESVKNNLKSNFALIHI